MTRVFNILTSPEGRPLHHQTVRITLHAPGNPFTSNTLTSEVINGTAEDTNAAGRWEADLIPNSEYDQAGTYYVADERDGLRGASAADFVHAFVVPATGGPYWIRDLLIIPPNPGGPTPPLPPHALGDHTDVSTVGETAGQVLKFNGTKWVPAADGGGGASGSFEMHQVLPANTVNVPHLLGYRPALSLFSDDWSVQYDEFAVQHVDANNAIITTGQLFTGWVVAS